ncbi:MAG: hypothetical protein ABIE55_04190 [Candidatus Aenigmatarchaeota archaeon]
MNWKNFLKPDLKKIIVFSIELIILIFFIIYPPVLSSITHYDGTECSGSIEHYGYPITIFNIDSRHCIDTNYQKLYYVNYTNLILLLISFYIISCFIIWIYNKVKKK